MSRRGRAPAGAPFGTEKSSRNEYAARLNCSRGGPVRTKGSTARAIGRAASETVDAAAELAKVGRLQAQGSYYYRHGGSTQLFDNPAQPWPPPPVRLEKLGLNRAGQPVSALALDTQYRCPPDLAAFNVLPRTHHRARTTSVLHADGHVVSLANRDGRFTVEIRESAEVRESFPRILAVFEQADALP